MLNNGELYSIFAKMKRSSPLKFNSRPTIGIAMNTNPRSKAEVLEDLKHTTAAYEASLPKDPPSKPLFEMGPPGQGKIGNAVKAMTNPGVQMMTEEEALLKLNGLPLTSIAMLKGNDGHR